MDFTFEELDYFYQRGNIGKSKTHTFGIDHIYVSVNQGFGHYSYSKTDEGEIHFSSSTPTNVDVDTGSYDTSYMVKKFKSFEDFKADKPYFTKKD